MANLVAKAFIAKHYKCSFIEEIIMSSLESSKNLASVGSIMLFLSFIPFVGLIGLILVYLGMKGLSDYYKEPSIYQDALKGLIWGIIALIVTAVGVIFAFVVGIFTFGLGAIPIIIVLFVLDFVFYLLMAKNFRRAFSLLAQRSGEHSFETAGTLLWYGAILTIIGVGIIIIIIAWIFATIGFFSIKTTSQPTQTYGYNAPPPPPPTMTSQAQRYCPNCGTPVVANATFCPNCGKPLNT
jgi:uncharacterized membrane protein